MDRRVAQGRPPLARGFPTLSPFTAIAIGSALVAVALVVYTLSHPYRFYNHFEWQAMAFLEGQAAIRYPVHATPASPFANDFFQDVLPVPTTDGIARGLVPFPPLPAVVLMPFVALWGLATDGQLVFAILGALDIGIAWWMLGKLPIRTWVRIATTVFLGFGTVFWYAAQIGTTWYQAHVLAVGLALAAIGVALGGDRDAARSEDDLDDADEPEPASAGPGSEATRDGGEAFFCVVDLHSITTAFEPDALRESTLSVAAWLFATGLDMERSTVFVQSHVVAHAEAAWLLGVQELTELRGLLGRRVRARR